MQQVQRRARATAASPNAISFTTAMLAPKISKLAAAVVELDPPLGAGEDVAEHPLDRSARSRRSAAPTSSSASPAAAGRSAAAASARPPRRTAARSPAGRAAGRAPVCVGEVPGEVGGEDEERRVGDHHHPHHAEVEGEARRPGGRRARPAARPRMMLCRSREPDDQCRVTTPASGDEVGLGLRPRAARSGSSRRRTAGSCARSAAGPSSSQLSGPTTVSTGCSRRQSISFCWHSARGSAQSAASTAAATT